MTIKRLTISLPTKLAKRVKAAAGKTPVSAWVADLIEGHLDEAELDRQWNAYCDAVGVTDDDLATAAELADELTQPKGKSAA